METLKTISEETIKRYSTRYKKMGCDVKTLGWGSTEQQKYRFAQTIDCNIDFKNKSILDIGCGFGDYLDFLLENDIKIKNYIGYDLNAELIGEAQKKHTYEFATFDVENILDTQKQNVADIGVMLGLLNFNLKNTMDNIEYSKLAIQQAFSMVNEVLIVDFLSMHLTPNYAKEDFVFYHNPSAMLDFALTLSRNVFLKHNYAPIPQKEFMLFIYKD